MVALSHIIGIYIVLQARLEFPFNRYLAVFVVICRYLCFSDCALTVRIVSARHYKARCFAVKIGYAAKKAVNAVSACVAPVLYIAALGQKVRRGESLACASLKYGQVFGTCKYISALICPVLIWIAYCGACSVNGAVGCSYRYLRSAVAVEVINYYRNIVLSGAYV